MKRYGSAVLLAASAFLLLWGSILAGLSLSSEHDRERCAERWEPRQTQWERRNGCIVLLDGYWVPEGRISVRLDGEK